MIPFDLLFGAESIKIRVAVVGSRKYAVLGDVRRYISQLPKNIILVSGGAKGVDSVVESVAKQYEIEFKIFKANWNAHGKSAGPIRNSEIIKNSDYVVAFWDGESRGTLDTINKALKAPNIKCVTVYKNKDEIE